MERIISCIIGFVVGCLCLLLLYSYSVYSNIVTDRNSDNQTVQEIPIDTESTERKGYNKHDNIVQYKSHWLF